MDIILNLLLLVIDISHDRINCLTQLLFLLCGSVFAPNREDVVQAESFKELNLCLDKIFITDDLFELQ